MRPIVVMIMMAQVRATLKNVLLNFKDILIVLLCIFIFIGFYSVLAVFFFKYTYEGSWQLQTLTEAYYNLTILLTTCNFPNVMLTAYNYNRSYSIFFIVFLIIGLNFLLRVLLGVVFENYKKGVEGRTVKKAESRIETIR